MHRLLIGTGQASPFHLHYLNQLDAKFNEMQKWIKCKNKFKTETVFTNGLDLGLGWIIVSISRQISLCMNYLTKDQ